MSRQQKRGALIPYPKLNRTHHVDISADDTQREELDQGPHSDRTVLGTRQSQSRRLSTADFCIGREEIEEAFDFFDVFGKKRLGPKDLRMRMNAFYPNLSTREYNLLLGNQGSFTM